MVQRREPKLRMADTPIKTLTLGCMNVRGIMSKTCYIAKTLTMHKLDIFGICEHWLYPDSLPFLSSLDHLYNAHGVADADLGIYDLHRRGKGGVALLWRKTIDRYITKLTLDDDRVIGLTVSLPEATPTHVLMVYLPSAAAGRQQFLDCLSKLRDIYEHYSTIGDVIIMGDLNCELSGPRYTARRGHRETCLANWTDSVGLHSVTVQESCTGPTYTFDHYESGTHRALIDHILVPASLMDLVVAAAVIDEDCDNQSDHLPVTLTLETVPVHVTQQQGTPEAKLMWKKASWKDLADYSTCLSYLLGEIQPPTVGSCSKSEVERYYNSIVRSMVEAAALVVPKSQYRPHLKPYWNKDLKHAHAEMRAKRATWIAAGRPKNNNPLQLEYKKSKSKFRAIQRQSINKKARAEYEQLDEMADSSINDFWVSFRRKRRWIARKPECREMKFKDTTVRTQKDIAEGWACYFYDLYSPLADVTFNADHKGLIDDLFNTYAEKEVEPHPPFSYSDVERACKK